MTVDMFLIINVKIWLSFCCPVPTFLIRVDWTIPLLVLGVVCHSKERNTWYYITMCQKHKKHRQKRKLETYHGWNSLTFSHEIMPDWLTRCENQSIIYYRGNDSKCYSFNRNLRNWTRTACMLCQNKKFLLYHNVFFNFCFLSNQLCIINK